MKKIIFGIFAHPDDEAFGPSGALLLEAKAGNDIHLITLTLGDAGTNPDNVPDLSVVREEEWRKAGGLIGAKSMHYLGYKDGQLNNLSMIEIGDKLISLVSLLTADEADDVVIEFMSLDTNGFTGHIDHIVAARAACFAFYRLKVADPRVRRIRLACIGNEDLPTINTDWLYMEAGRQPEEIGDTTDARMHQAEIRAIIRAHYSQRHDAENHINRSQDKLGINYFIVKD